MTVKFDCSLSDISNYFKEKGFFYSEEQIYNFYISLKTKPFVILSGISGSGKSKIADLFAEYMGILHGNKDNYELVPVKPNWTDSRGVFGYHNLLNDTYQITSTVKLFLRALANPEKPYFLVLDEMNLAKVEYYFSDFLSLLESRRESIIEVRDTNFENIHERLNNRKITLSEAIILSALQIDRDDFNPVREYRNTEIAKWWNLKYSQSQNAEAQFRSELNQGRPRDATNPDNGYRLDGTRLAGKAFWAETSGNSYKLKSLSEMDADTRKKVEDLRDAFITSKRIIKQEKIYLHGNKIPLKANEHQGDYQDYLYNKGEYFIPSEIEIPINVFVIGTVNVDETTYMFSPKVLDRGNVIEFNDVDLFHAYGFGVEKEIATRLPSEANKKFSLNISIPNSETTKYFIKKYSESFSIINEIFETLKKENKQFGYRVFNEISLFILNYVGEDATKENLIDAIDIQILQKVLPKINGTDDEILGLMNSFKEIAEKNSLVWSEQKINRMLNKLKTTGYATFIE
ncbi:AAA family ATPase [Enterococcus innesii]|uniref:AAA family ATPase n=1 Tax=Enterococcus innesii TaxID=2839759 RepID=UPI002DB771E0|nr:AAA family ATPase [Enterococcus innesii]MEB5952684.1 AAA family ATPase [Enterococcus innesii]